MSKFAELRKYVKDKRVAKYRRLKNYLTEREFFKESLNEMKNMYLIFGLVGSSIVIGKLSGCDDKDYLTHKPYMNTRYGADTSKINSNFADTTKHIKSLEDSVK